MNRSGLKHLSYRLGNFDLFRRQLFEKLNRSKSLRQWTYRGSDDPGIALLEGGAILGDIITMYQEVYANEAFLRTAEWDRSIEDLVRLLGVRPSPGVGGRCYIHLNLRAGAPTLVRKGSVFQSELKNLSRPVDWESSEDLEIWPQMSSLQLKWPKEYQFPTGVGEAIVDLSCRQNTNLRTPLGRNLFIATGEQSSWSFWPTPEGEWLSGELTSALSTVLHAQRIIFYQVQVTLNGDLTPRSGLSLGARHSGIAESKIVVAAVSSTIKNVFVFEGVDSNLQSNDFALIKNESGHFQVRQIERIEIRTSGAGTNLVVRTYVVLDRPIYSGDVGDTVPLSGYELSKINSQWLILVGRDPYFVVPDQQENAVKFLMLADPSLSCKVLDQRQVCFQKNEGAFELRTIRLVNEDLRLFSLDGPLSTDFTYDDFDSEQASLVKIYGNILELNQGKRKINVVVGSGNSRETHQTFAVPEPDLTYFPSPENPTELLPELEVFVQGRLWQYVETFLDKQGDERIYIVRQDQGGKSWIQFGDGVNGARLPTGTDNVVIQYRVGVAARGVLKDETKVRATTKIDRLENIVALGEAWGGREAESSMTVKNYAPQKVQALGRLVSLSDYEAEVRKIPGVLQVLATWGGMVGEGQQIDFLVLAASLDTQTQFEIEDAIKNLDRQSGLGRLNLSVSFGEFVEAFLYAVVKYDPKLVSRNLLENQMEEVLGVWGTEPKVRGEGLFSISQRNFGKNEYQSRIAGYLQNLPGVQYVQIVSFGTYVDNQEIPPSFDPAVVTNKEIQEKTEISSRSWLVLRGSQVLIDWSPV